MKNKTKAIRAAFPFTIPVLTGYILLGAAYGILMTSNGYGLGWILLMSLVVYAGSAQYVAVTFLTAVFNPLNALMVTLMVNARHLFYGISMLEKYKDSGNIKPYLIFGLTDETFSIVCASKPPSEVSRRWFYFFITLCNQCYWVLGSVIGGVIGSMVSFNTKGLDFVLTALFVVIFVDQWKSQKIHKPAIIGVLSSFICLLIFGPDNFIITSMITILLALTIYRKEYREKIKLLEGEL